MQRVDAAVVGHGEARRPRRLRRDLAAEEAGPADVAGGVEAPEDVAVELLEIEDGQELRDITRFGLTGFDRFRRLDHDPEP